MLGSASLIVIAYRSLVVTVSDVLTAKRPTNDAIHSC